MSELKAHCLPISIPSKNIVYPVHPTFQSLEKKEREIGESLEWTSTGIP
jgi:hypothetical protein